MENNEQRYYGKVLAFNEDKKFIESVIMHFDVANENRWLAKAGSLDKFFERLNKSKKGVAACYQHDESLLIGVWKDFVISGNELIGKLYYVETPFVKDTVLPQLRAGILQGSSPTMGAINEGYDNQAGVWEIHEGYLCEISLVGLPADFRADIIQLKAMIESNKKIEDDFDLFII